MATFGQKLNISLSSAALFILVSLPFTYKLTNNLVNTFSGGCPTTLGVILHSIVFFLLTYFSMGKGGNQGIKLKHSLYGTLIYFFVSNPVTYQFVRSILPFVASPAGCPSFAGIITHAIVYTAALVGVMYLP